MYKEDDKWWPRLLSANTKFHWLKVDFNKWKDDDDESGDEGGFNENSYEDMMRQLGGGMGGAPDFGNFNIDGAGQDEKDEEDDEKLPGKNGLFICSRSISKNILILSLLSLHRA